MEATPARPDGFGGCGRSQHCNVLAELCDLVAGERTLGFERGEQQLLNRARGLAGCDEAHGWADAAQIMRAAVGASQRLD
jgi:hypothetical protein